MATDARFDWQLVETIARQASEKALNDANLLTSQITSSQERAIRRLAELLIEHQSHGHPEEIEFKRFEIKALDWSRELWIRTTIGRKGDEGTMAETFCRDHRTIGVGVRGALRLISVDHGPGFYRSYKGDSIHGRAVAWHLPPAKK